ncbi:hypothetical protein EV363DRAFT_245229 [Boletus edulis]|nr:hypothetical protein EV363DRAFT_245229 [Boletus edulis]
MMKSSTFDRLGFHSGNLPDTVFSFLVVNIFKWVYFFLRYVVILAHLTHNVFIKQLADGSNPPIHCTMWFIYSFGFSQVLATLLELILATRGRCFPR